MNFSMSSAIALLLASAPALLQAALARGLLFVAMALRSAKLSVAVVGKSDGPCGRCVAVREVGRVPGNALSL